MAIDDYDVAQDRTLAGVKSAYQASLKLATTEGAKRSYGVGCMAQAIEEGFEEILEANTLDLETSREMAVSDIIIDWLRLTPERLHSTINILRRLEETARSSPTAKKSSLSTRIFADLLSSNAIRDYCFCL